MLSEWGKTKILRNKTDTCVYLCQANNSVCQYIRFSYVNMRPGLMGSWKTSPENVIYSKKNCDQKRDKKKTTRKKLIDCSVAAVSRFSFQDSHYLSTFIVTPHKILWGLGGLVKITLHCLILLCFVIST